MDGDQNGMKEGKLDLYYPNSNNFVSYVDLTLDIYTFILNYPVSLQNDFWESSCFNSNLSDLLSKDIRTHSGNGFYF
jgi:hypothetical protein